MKKATYPIIFSRGIFVITIHLLFSFSIAVALMNFVISLILSCVSFSVFAIHNINKTNEKPYLIPFYLSFSFFSLPSLFPSKLASSYRLMLVAFSFPFPSFSSYRQMISRDLLFQSQALSLSPLRYSKLLHLS